MHMREVKHVHVPLQVNLIGRCLHPLFELILQGLGKMLYKFLLLQREQDKLILCGATAVNLAELGEHNHERQGSRSAIFCPGTKH